MTSSSSPSAGDRREELSDEREARLAELERLAKACDVPVRLHSDLDKFHAAANPAVVLRLIAALRDRDEQREEDTK